MHDGNGKTHRNQERTTKMKTLFTTLGVAAMLAAAALSHAVQLPQDHEYQVVLRDYMGTVTEADLTHGVTGDVEVKPGDFDPEYLYRNHIYTMMLQPLIGSKRGAPAINAAAITFTLPFIEVREPISTVFKHPRKDPEVVTFTPGVYRTWAWPEVLISFVRWNYPGNPYFNNRALKLRAFMTAAADMMMFHDFAEKNDTKIPPPIRSDWHGYSPVVWAYPYPEFKDVLPEEVQKAYETGMKIIGERILSWGIRGESSEDDFIAPVGLLSIARAIDDPDFSKSVEAYTRPLFTDARYFHPAGYWDERGGIDTGFSGSANWFAIWIALMTDWPFAREALDRVYRLRGHLLLPEPDGTFTGPSHFNSRLGSPANQDQWAWGGARDAAAAMVTDESAHLLETITRQQLLNAPAERAANFNSALGENIRIDGHYLTHAEMLDYKVPPRAPWSLRRWMSYDFPASVNPGYEHYRQGAWAHRQEMEASDSPMLKSPFLRNENFLRAFGQDFVVTRQPGFAAILHTGPVGTQSPDDNKAQFPGPMGLSGGQLSAFWTPASGSVILGLRSGMSYAKSFDLLEGWRTWPQHAVIGITAEGKIFTSSRHARPETVASLQDHAATVKVSGTLVAMQLLVNDDAERGRDHMYDDTLNGKVDYTRVFSVDDRGVKVETSVSGDGKDAIAELYEVLPIYLRDAKRQPQATPTTIEFQTDETWAPATVDYQDLVTAVRLTRFEGVVIIAFDNPQRVKLSPADWSDTWLTRNQSRNVLIDLLGSDGKPATIDGEKSVSYTIRGL